jgi:hypothetical protein
MTHKAASLCVSETRRAGLRVVTVRSGETVKVCGTWKRRQLRLF